MQVYVLKGKVRDNIPEATFVVQPDLPQEGYDLQVSARLDLTRSLSQDISLQIDGSERGWFSVNLQVLWTSPDITVCDAYRLSHLLARDIYHQVDIFIVENLSNS